PSPQPLDRFVAGQSVVSGTVLLGAAAGSDLTGAIAQVLSNISAETYALFDAGVHQAAATVGLATQAYTPAAEDGQKFKALVF
ncbi:short chain dehydrogenase, partial [Acinetobacter baumannii]